MADDAGEVMTDADFEKALDALREQEPNGEVGELLKMMNENRMISWEEAEQILGGSSYNEPIKSSLPEQTRPTEPDNDTDVDESIQKLLQNDPKLKEINLNNMKRTPIPQVKRLIAAIRDNTFLEKLSLANMGLYDSNVEPLIDVVENNSTLKAVNLETNYISGDFFAKLFQAALKNQTLEEVKAVNQGVTFSTVSEKEIIDAIFANRGIIKVSINLRLPEGRHKIENAMLRNGEIKRVLRRQAAQAAKAADEANKKAEQETTTKKTDEVKKSSPKKAATKASTGTTKVAPTKDGTTTATKIPAETPAMTAAGAAKTLTKTPAKPAAKTPTKTKAPSTKAKTADVPAEEDKKTEAKTTAKPLAKTAPKVPAKTAVSTKALSKSTAAKAAADSSTTEAATKAPAKSAAATTASSDKQPDTSATKPTAKTAPAVPPKKTTISKTASDKPASAEKSEAAATAKEATASKTTSKKTPTKKVEQPLPVYPLKKSQKQ
uniref:Tropomodulin n=1 Tax=Parascaris univalens TaxID=6257 RepID=A0A914ZJH9_PARUN